MCSEEEKKFVEYLKQFVTDNKKNKFKEVLEWRTRHIAVVLEDIYQPLNASAIIRSCDCFGIQDLHVVENVNRFKDTQGVSRGAFKWVNVERHTSLDDAVKFFKKNKYSLVVTSPAAKKSICDLPLNNKVALAFGTEWTGASDELIEKADDLVSIPMCGFTESFNVSVSVALCLYELTSRLHKSDIKWRLTENEKQGMIFQWLKAVVKDPEKYKKYFNKKSEK
ncbi:RNA methyltransferase [bacterium]|mgnify:CR=1 FL=1|nr:RNA methyltransferase [bacterium]